MPDRTVLGKMNPAFFAGVFLPPPAACAFVFARLDRPRARSAPDAGISLRVQRMNGNTVLVDVGIHLPDGPVRQRCESQAAIDLFHFAYAGPSGRLLPAQARRPHTKLTELA